MYILQDKYIFTNMIRKIQNLPTVSSLPGLTQHSSIPPLVIVVLDTTIQHFKKVFNLTKPSTSTPTPLDSGSEAGMTRSWKGFGKIDK